MPGVNFQRTYKLGDFYARSKERATLILDRFLKYPNLIIFNDVDRSVTFTTERLIPNISTKRPCVMFLYSNPHPYSIYQGMFLSPSIKGQESLFWSTARDAGWIRIAEEKPNTRQLAEICLNVQYQGPFDLIFYCYYAFPTSYPEDIRKIFGKEYFKQVIEPEAMNEFQKTIQETKVEAVVTFNKEIFNLVSANPIGLYINRLIKGELIKSKVTGIDREIPVFLTFPTGWRYHKDHQFHRRNSLSAIRTAICKKSEE